MNECRTCVRRGQQKYGYSNPLMINNNKKIHNYYLAVEEKVDRIMIEN